MKSQTISLLFYLFIYLFTISNLSLLIIKQTSTKPNYGFVSIDTSRYLLILFLRVLIKVIIHGFFLQILVSFSQLST